VTDFPLYEYSEEENRYVACHHPFTAPKDGDLEKMVSEPAATKARAYDMVLNGNEVGGGSIRIHEAAVQRKMFEALGFSKESYESQLFHSGARAWGPAAWRHRLRFGSPDHADVRFAVHPRRHRLPQDPEGYLPHDQRARYRVREAAS
jgi:aspartyl-tRNA synthetase